MCTALVILFLLLTAVKPLKYGSQVRCSWRIIVSAHAAGQPVTPYVGSGIYLKWGVTPCYWVCAELLLLSVLICYFILPDSDDKPYIPIPDTKKPLKEGSNANFYDIHADTVKDTNAKSFSPVLCLLVLALVIIQIVPGFVFITLLPHLEECCDLQLHQTAHYLYIYYIACGDGYVISGIISQVKYLRLRNQAILRAVSFKLSYYNEYKSYLR